MPAGPASKMRAVVKPPRRKSSECACALAPAEGAKLVRRALEGASVDKGMLFFAVEAALLASLKDPELLTRLRTMLEVAVASSNGSGETDYVARQLLELLIDEQQKGVANE